MTELRDFENDVRATLANVANSAEEPPGLAERLIAGAAQRRAPHRVQLWLSKRWIPPTLAAATVAIVAIATVATVSAVQADRRTRPAHPTPAPTPTTNSPTPTPDTTTPTPSPTATATATKHAPVPATHTTSPTTTSRSASKTTSTPPAPSGRWTDNTIVITAQSLGAVTRGMTLDQAKTAAGISLSSPGDGIFRPTDHTITGSTVPQFSWGVTCFDATRSTSGPGTTVTTSAGVRLGDSMTQIAATYGSMAKPFTADPTWTGAGNIPAGIIVQTDNGVLLFVGSSSDQRGGTIMSIRGAADAFHASSIFC